MPRLQAHRAAAWEPLTTPAAVAVFTTVLTQEPVSRADIARRTGLSGAAVTKAARPFLDAGYLQELSTEDRGNAALGRPSSPLAINPTREYFLGIKITAGEITGLVTDLRAQVREVTHHPLRSTEVGYVVDELTAVVDRLINRSPDYADRCHSLGIAISGDVDRRTGLVRLSPFLDWRDVPLGDLVGRRTGLVTTVENDVKALATTEWWFGEGVGANSFALVTIGAGIGCALMLNNGILAGAYGVAGELGHLPVGGHETPCACGARGCVEAIASETAIVARAREVSGDPWLTMSAAVRQARDGDAAMRQVFDRAGHAIGLALVSVANLVGPERIIVSGEGVSAYDLMQDEIRTTFARHAFGAAGRSSLVIRPLPFEVWARGAAAVSIQTLFSPAKDPRGEAATGILG